MSHWDKLLEDGTLGMTPEFKAEEVAKIKATRKPPWVRGVHIERGERISTLRIKQRGFENRYAVLTCVHNEIQLTFKSMGHSQMLSYASVEELVEAGWVTTTETSEYRGGVEMLPDELGENQPDDPQVVQRQIETKKVT